MTLVANIAATELAAGNGTFGSAQTHRGAQPGAIQLSETQTSARQRRAPMRLTKRGRVVFTIMIALPLLIALAVTALSGVAAIGTDRTAEPLQYVTVSQGDSLWNIATQIAPESDPRDVVQDIVNLNRLDSSIVHGGQTLALPAYANSSTN